MNQFSSQNTKGEILKAFMMHPGTAKLVKEAMSSPLGSTSRMKLQKILSISQKLRPKDGIGGPGMTMQRYTTSMPAPEYDPAHIPSDGSQGLVIFPTCPTPKFNYGGESHASKFKPRAGSYDGMGGPGNVLDSSVFGFSSLGSNLSNLSVGGGSGFDLGLTLADLSKPQPVGGLFSTNSNSTQPTAAGAGNAFQYTFNANAVPQQKVFQDPNTSTFSMMTNTGYTPSLTGGGIPTATTAQSTNKWSTFVNTTPNMSNLSISGTAAAPTISEAKQSDQAAIAASNQQKSLADCG